MALQKIELDEIDPAPEQGAPLVGENLDLVKGVKVKLDVVLGQAELSVGELFGLSKGAVVQLDRDVDALVDVVLDGRVVARGTLVAVDDAFGVSIVETVK